MTSLHLASKRGPMRHAVSSGQAGTRTAVYIAAGLKLLGWLVPTIWCQPLAIASAVGSLLPAVLWWHPYSLISAVVDTAARVSLLLTAGWLVTEPAGGCSPDHQTEGDAQ